MTTKTVLAACALCVILCFALAVLDGTAHAAEKEKGLKGDKDLATRKGLDSLGTKEFDQKRLPGKLQYGIVIGSFIAMIAVVKWV